MDAAEKKSLSSGEISSKESEAGILPSHGISLDLPDDSGDGRPSVIRHLSTPAYQSPLRHHRRTPSAHREVKETLNARSEYTNSQDDGKSQHHINQYIIGEEIGRGSFGAVHLATDQYGWEFAVKEFSKSRLRKRAQSNILRRPHHQRRPGHLAAGIGLNAPLHRHSASDINEDEEQGNPLYLIKEEIAIMKKLNHPNLVSLIEVLDDPEEDSLYMVLELCKKGVVMKVGLGDTATPYETEKCRCWFRDLILGIEYLHAQGVVHRDIKPDNLLLTEDDVLKIVDFGVSEMFEKTGEMMTAKSAGSPAFLPPELCVAKHGDISGKAADIWSMGVSLYCLKFGRIPFERTGVLELYDSIKKDKLEFPKEDDPHFRHLMIRLLEKDPKKRIKMEEIREHPWVTKNGADPLLAKEDNVDNLVGPPTEHEMNHAITGNFRNLMAVMKAVNKFKEKMHKKRPELMSKMLGKEVRIVLPPGRIEGGSMDPSSFVKNLGDAHPPIRKSRSVDTEDRRHVDTVLALEGVTRDVDTGEISKEARPALSLTDSSKTITQHIPGAFIDTPPRVSSPTQKGHAQDPLEEEPLFLGIGTGTIAVTEADPEPSSSQPENVDVAPPVTDSVAESPLAAEFNIYDTAYREEVDRIREAQGHQTTVYLTRRVDSKIEYKKDENMLGPSNHAEGAVGAGFKGLVDAARENDQAEKPAKPVAGGTTGESLMGIVDDASERAGLLRENMGLKFASTGHGIKNSMDKRGMPRMLDGWRTTSDEFRKSFDERRGEIKKSVDERREGARDIGERTRSAFSGAMGRVMPGSKKETPKGEGSHFRAQHEAEQVEPVEENKEAD